MSKRVDDILYGRVLTREDARRYEWKESLNQRVQASLSGVQASGFNPAQPRNKEGEWGGGGSGSGSSGAAPTTADWVKGSGGLTGNGHEGHGSHLAEGPDSEKAIRSANTARRAEILAEKIPAGTTFLGESDPVKIGDRISHSWGIASTGGKDVPEGLKEDTMVADALRLAATERVGAPADHYTGQRVDDAKKFYSENKEVLDAFADAQYQSTQEYLKKEGVDQVLGFRGTSFYDEPSDSFKTPDWAKAADGKDTWVTASPPKTSLTSYSTSLEVAGNFTEGQSGITRAAIPAADVFGTYRTGLGTYREDEVVTIGRASDAETKVFDADETYLGGADGPQTQKQFLEP